MPCLADQLAQMAGGGLHVLEPRPLSLRIKFLDQIDEKAGHVVRFLADLDPQDAVGELEPDVGVTGEIVRDMVLP
jgi:hypothetical protein